MTDHQRRLLVLAVLAWCAGTTAEATTIRPPRDLGQLASMSRAVVLARASTGWVEDRGLPMTVTTFELEESLGGRPVRATFEVEVPGGELAETAAWIAGAPRFAEGRSYLLFLARSPHGRWRPQMLAYGVFEASDDKEILRPLPSSAQIALHDEARAEALTPFRTRPLLDHLREVLAGAPWDRRRAGAVPEPLVDKLHTKPAACQFMTDAGDGLPLRKFGYETGATMSIAHTTPGQTGIADGGVAAVQQGAAAWTDHPDSVMRFLYAGIRPRAISCSASSDLDQGGVVFNDPCSDIADLVGCAGTLAFGGSFYNPATRPIYDGEPWHDLSTPFVVVNNGTQCVGETGFREMMTHELGHTQGFGHHTDPQATMAAVLKNDGRGAALRATDRACASYAYHTFWDVPYNHASWRDIEAIENADITNGCTATNYCPSSGVSRGEIAVFLLRAREGGGYVPPSCTAPRFSDVPCSHPFAGFINEFARRGITSGCTATTYCPASGTTRQQIVVFLLRTREGSGYSPPACVVPMFADVPCSYPFAAFINEAARRGITQGCGGGNFCPQAKVSRAEMATLVVRTFFLPTP